MKPTFFPTPFDWNKWLKKNHDKEQEVLIGFYKKDSAKPSITWPESVEEALCFGWIDGVRKSIDAESYTIRFTPRRPKSNWSAVNIALVEKLIKEKRMQPAGLKAFEARSASKSKIYAYEKELKTLPEDYEKQFKANKKAWDYFSQKAPGYRKTAIHWVVSAKQEATREKRFQTLMQCSEDQTTIPQLTPTRKK
ncbi:MAG: YdeI/OmpD-associated family protein [Bacteroidia bacterium]